MTDQRETFGILKKHIVGKSRAHQGSFERESRPISRATETLGFFNNRQVSLTNERQSEKRIKLRNHMASYNQSTQQLSAAKIGTPSVADSKEFMRQVHTIKISNKDGT